MKQLNRLKGDRDFEKEWTSWSECLKGSQKRERTNPDSELGKEFETKLCSKGFPTPKPRADVGSFGDYAEGQLNRAMASRFSEKEYGGDYAEDQKDNGVGGTGTDYSSNPGRKTLINPNC